MRELLIEEVQTISGGLLAFGTGLIGGMEEWDYAQIMLGATAFGGVTGGICGIIFSDGNVILETLMGISFGVIIEGGLAHIGYFMGDALRPKETTSN